MKFTVFDVLMYFELAVVVPRLVLAFRPAVFVEAVTLELAVFIPLLKLACVRHVGAWYVALLAADFKIVLQLSVLEGVAIPVQASFTYGSR